MAWWDLVGQTLGKPLHELWAELFEVGFSPPVRVPLAAYSWQRFPDAEGRDAVTFESWPQFAAQQVAEGFTTLKLSMTSYEPDDHVELVARIRDAVPARDRHPHRHARQLELRRGAPHHAGPRALSRAVHRAADRIAPAPSLLHGGRRPRAEGGFQREYYFRKLEELRRDTGLAISCHWWTPPIVQPDGLPRGADAWEFDWYLMERYDPVDVAVPDIGLGVFGLWRLFQMTRFMGLHLQIHSNSELGLQSSFTRRDVRGARLLPRVGRPLPRDDAAPLRPHGHRVQPGARRRAHGRQAPAPRRAHRAVTAAGARPHARPERLERYRWTEERARVFREQASAVSENYLLDRPRRRTMSGWPKRPGPERFDRQAYPYDLTQMLGGDRAQDVDVELNT